MNKALVLPVILIVLAISLYIGTTSYVENTNIKAITSTATPASVGYGTVVGNAESKPDISLNGSIWITQVSTVEYTGTVLLNVDQQGRFMWSLDLDAAEGDELLNTAVMGRFEYSGHVLKGKDLQGALSLLPDDGLVAVHSISDHELVIIEGNLQRTVYQRFNNQGYVKQRDF